MKTQIKPFVVEHKVARRSERRAIKSIWGDVDLATAAEQVIVDSPGGPGDPQKRPDEES